MNTVKELTTKGAQIVNLRNNVRNYILESISTENYEGETLKNDVDKLQFVMNTFIDEYCNEYNLRQYKTCQSVFAQYLMGLPSCIDIEYRNYYIIELAKQWQSIPVNATEKQEDKILDNWFNFIAAHFMMLCAKYKIYPKLQTV